MTSELVERLRFQGRYGHETQDQMAARKVAERLAAADEIERLTAQLAEARQAERAAVVAWLRKRDEAGVEWLAAWIEAGDHLQKEGVLPDE